MSLLDANGMSSCQFHLVDTSSPRRSSHLGYLGLCGWRKRCLYSLVAALLVLSIINMYLIIWIMKVTKFSLDGIGNLKITLDGVTVNGDLEVMKSVQAAEVQAYQDLPLLLHSQSNITLKAYNGKTYSSLQLNPEAIVAETSVFEIKSQDGKHILYADEDGIVIGVKTLKSLGKDGVVFGGSVVTSYVRADTNQDLRLESISRSVKFSAPKGVDILSTNGGVNMTIKNSILLTSLEGSLFMDSRSIQMKNLPVSSPKLDGKIYPEVMQVCLCKGSGHIFLAEANVSCKASKDICS